MYKLPGTKTFVDYDGTRPVVDGPGHDPVLMTQVLDAIFPAGRSPKVVVDCTLGRAGHASAILHRLAPSALLIGIDKDPRNLEFAARRLSAATHSIPATQLAKHRLIHANFTNLQDVLRHVDVVQVDAILADLGVSTNQLFDDRYGLSFATDAPLDMRLNPDDPISAADLVNRMAEKELADLIYLNADERYSRRIARKIVEARAASPINTTKRLADLVRSVVPVHRPVGNRTRRSRQPTIDPATRTFMALRMRVNKEVECLESFLKIAPSTLAEGGRLAVISFHSTEDRIVKHMFRTLASSPQFTLINKKPVEPNESEVEQNPRSRSAKMRVLERSAE